MLENAYHQLAFVEDTHWWFLARRQLASKVLKDYAVCMDECLDVGCGTGGNAHYLSNYARRVVGVDCSEVAIASAREKYKNTEFVLGDANELAQTFTANSFDLITDFNVLYHKWIKSDVDVLRQIHVLLKPKGHILLTEPALKFLYRKHDSSAMGEKRFGAKELTDLLCSAGFRVLFFTGFNLACLPPAFLLAILEKWRKSSPESLNSVGEIKLLPEWINNIMLQLMGLERFAIHLLRGLPLGLTYLALAQKV